MLCCGRKALSIGVASVIVSMCYGGDFSSQLADKLLKPIFKPETQVGEKPQASSDHVADKAKTNNTPKLHQQLNASNKSAKYNGIKHDLAFPALIKPLDWSAVPEMFMADFKQSDFSVSAHFAGTNLGDFNVRVLSDHRLYIDLQKVFHKLQLKPVVKQYLTELFKSGMLINKIIHCNPSLIAQNICTGAKPVFLANLNLDSLRLDFYVDRHLFVNQNSGAIAYLPDPYKQYLSSVFKYNINLAQNFGNAQNDSTASLALSNVTGYGKTHIVSSGYASVSDESSDASLSQIQVIHDFKRTALAVGYNNYGNIYGSNALGLSYGYSNGMLGAAWYSSTNRIQNQGSASINPIIIFLNRQATVRVYRNGQLLTVQNYGIGSHEIDTTGFPTGVYPIRIEIYNGSQLLRTEVKIVNKPFPTAGLGPDNSIAFTTWAGIARNYNATTFTLPYMGASIKGILSRYVMGQLASYFVGALSVYEVDATLAFPWEINLLASAGHDSQGGYAANLNLQKAFSDWLSLNAYYNQSAKSIERSPFSSDQSQVGLGVSLGLGLFGSLSVNGSFDFRQDSTSYNANYAVTLFQKYGFYVTGNVNATWQSQEADSATRAFDYSVGLTLTYNFDNGSSVDLNSTYHPYTRASEHTVSFNPALDTDDFISSVNVGASYSHDPEATADNTTAYANVDFNQTWLQGGLNAQAQFGDDRTQSLSGSLEGSFVVNSNGIAASQNQGDSGLFVDLPSTTDVDMNMIVNGSFYPVHSGRNFIPLAAYEPYHAYLLQGDNTEQQLVWKHFDDDFVLYPGNVYPTTRKITSVVQVIGQVNSGDQVSTYTAINSSVDSTTTDSNGFFNMQIDPQKPLLELTTSEGDHCQYRLTSKQLSKLHQGSWLGVIQCQRKHNVSNNAADMAVSAIVKAKPQTGQF